MIARVVTRREDTESALVLTAFAATALALVLADDRALHRLWPTPTDAGYLFVATMIVLAGIGPWMARTRRGHAAELRIGERCIVAGDTTIDAGTVTGLSVVEAARGRSIAVARGSRITFLEVARAEDAALVVHARGVGDCGQIRTGTKTPPCPRQHDHPHLAVSSGLLKRLAQFTQ